MNNQIVGTCSLCGGPVTVPSVWHSVIPAVPECGNCGAVAASHGPVIPMQPRRSFQGTFYYDVCNVCGVMKPFGIHCDHETTLEPPPET